VPGRSGKGLALEAAPTTDSELATERAPPVADRPVEGQFTLASAPVRTVLADGAPQASAPGTLHWLTRGPPVIGLMLHWLPPMASEQTLW
jgi:hypothetical protein